MIVGGFSKREPAIDYIIEDEAAETHYRMNKRTNLKIKSYKEQQRRRELTVILKNAIMVIWSDVKKKRNKKPMDEIMKELQ